jgi:tetratricopeptide (TPR) repeat protein
MRNKLLVLFVAAFVGYLSYCALAQYEYSQGKAAFKAGNWLSAWMHFERADGYKLTLPSHSSEIPLWKDQTSLLLLGQSMRDQGKYKEALDAYTSLITLYPEADATVLVADLFPVVYLEWGNHLREQSDYAGAVEKLEVVTHEYAQTPSVKPVNEAEAETYREWGDALMKKADYEAAAEKYQVVLTRFSTQPAAKDVKDVLGEVYLQWADSLRKNNQPGLALEKYNFAISSFNNTSSSKKAEAELAPTMLEWTLALHKDKEFAKEVEVLRNLMEDNKNTPEAKQASTRIVPAYDSLGRQLIEDKSFIKSMQAYTDAKIYVADADSQSIVDAGYEAAAQGLAYDSENDGTQVISETLGTACAGKPVTSPVVGILKEGPGKGMVCTGSFTMPADLMPFTPAQFKYVVDIEYTTKDGQSCIYTPTGGNSGFRYVLIRQRNIAKVTVRNILTGEVVGSRDINGAMSVCPASYSFSSQTETLPGELVRDEDIASWLKQVFK